MSFLIAVGAGRHNVRWDIETTITSRVQMFGRGTQFLGLADGKPERPGEAFGVVFPHRQAAIKAATRLGKKGRSAEFGKAGGHQGSF